MKFNWGTGIFVFLTVFLLAAAAFIIFAFRQDVNLVHKDYYQKGADFDKQMEIDARSLAYRDSFKSYMEDGFFIVEFEETMSMKVDSGMALLFRPSDSDKDIAYRINSAKRIVVPREDLIPGRYILKMYWYDEGVKYEIDKPVSIH